MNEMMKECQHVGHEAYKVDRFRHVGGITVENSSRDTANNGQKVITRSDLTSAGKRLLVRSAQFEGRGGPVRRAILGSTEVAN